MSPEVAKFQISQSKAELEAALGAEVSAFCYPYGGESPELRAMVQAAGYTNATTTQRGLAQATDDPFGIPRVTVSRSTNIFRFLQKCLTRLEHRRASE
jgi:peptidoglycan/xylan/chitin deacetylase (PgdA/CDA1 family)